LRKSEWELLTTGGSTIKHSLEKRAIARKVLAGMGYNDMVETEGKRRVTSLIPLVR